MTNFEKIKNMSIEDMAKICLDYDDAYGVYRTMSGESFEIEEKEQAIQENIRWLESEAENE
jgi:hypothetical protein